MSKFQEYTASQEHLNNFFNEERYSAFHYWACTQKTCSVLTCKREYDHKIFSHILNSQLLGCMCDSAFTDGDFETLGWLLWEEGKSWDF